LICLMISGINISFSNLMDIFYENYKYFYKLYVIWGSHIGEEDVRIGLMVYTTV
jgi:hypothetical protein